jgi:hypothetical protein
MDKEQLILENLQKQLIEWNEKFGDLESRLLETKLSLKTNYSDVIEILHPEIKLVEMKMAELRDSGEIARQELRSGLQMAIKEMKNAFMKASLHSHISELN